MIPTDRIIKGDPVLTRIFSEVGRSYGYAVVTARFSEVSPIEMRWAGVRTGSIDFEISDYLRDAPECVLIDIADCLFRRIGKNPRPYSEVTMTYLSSDRFVDNARALFLSRESDHLDLDYEPIHHDLQRAVDRLMDIDGALLPEGVMFAWTDSEPTLGLLRIVTVPKRLDSEDVPEEVFDYYLYRQASAMPGGDMNPRDARRDYERRLSRYPDSQRLELMLRDILAPRATA